MKKLNRITTLILALTLLFTLTSCNVIDDIQRLGLKGWLNSGIKKEPEKTPDVVTTVPSSSIPPKTSKPITSLPQIPEIPDLDKLIIAQNIEFPENRNMIVTFSGTPNVHRFYGETVTKQSKLLKDKYSFSIVNSEKNVEEIEALLEKGEYFSDLLFLPLRAAVSFAEKGYLLDIGEHTPSFDYYSVTSEKEGKLGNYFAVTSYSVPYESSLVLLCNTDLLKRADICPDILAAALDGGFDDELFFDIVSKFDTSESKVGLLSEFSGFKVSAIFSSIPGFDGNIIDELAKRSQSEFAGIDAIEAFYNGLGAFLLADVSSVREFSDSYDSYAILPLPKASKSEKEYKTVYDADTLFVFAVPHSAANSECAVSYINALAKSSFYQYRYEFVDGLYSYYIREAASAVFTNVNKVSGLTSMELPSIEIPPDTTQVPDTYGDKTPEETATPSAAGTTAENTSENK